MDGNQNQSNIYKVQMYVRGTEDDAQALRKSLAQAVFDDFGLNEEEAVFGVKVEPDNPPSHEFVMALCMVELEDGLDIKQINKVLSTLPDNGRFLPIEIEAENSAAVGFIDAEFYELHNYDPVFISGRIKNILDEVKLESPDDVYETPDGQKFLMSYFND